MKDLEILTSHLGTALFLAVLYLCWLLRILSRRMGEVTRMPPYYRFFDIGNILLLIATLSYILVCSASLSQKPALLLAPMFLFWSFYMPLALGVGINLTITLVYWGWLARER